MNDVIKVDREGLEELALLVYYLQCGKDDIEVILKIIEQFDKIEWMKENKAYFFSYVLFPLYLRLDLFMIKGVIQDEEFKIFENKGLYIDDMKTVHRHLIEKKQITEDDIMLMNRIWYNNNYNINLKDLIIQIKNLICDNYYNEFKEHFMLYCQSRDDNNKLFIQMENDKLVEKLVFDIIQESETKCVPYYTFYNDNIDLFNPYIMTINYSLKNTKNSLKLSLLPYTTLFEVVLIISLKEKILFDSISIEGFEKQIDFGKTINQLGKTELHLKINEQFELNQFIEDNEEKIKLLLKQYYNSEDITTNNILPFTNLSKSKIMNEVNIDHIKNITDFLIKDNYYLLNILITFKLIGDESIPYLRIKNNVHFDYWKNKKMIGNDIEGLIFLEKSDNVQNTIQSYEKGLFISMYYYIQREILYHECQYDNILSFWYRDKIDWNKVSDLDKLLLTLQQVEKDKYISHYYFLISFFFIIIKRKRENDIEKYIETFFKQNLRSINPYLYCYYYHYIIHDCVLSDDIKNSIKSERLDNGLINYSSCIKINEKFISLESNIKKVRLSINNEKITKNFYSNTSIYELLFWVMLNKKCELELMTIKNCYKIIEEKDYKKVIIDYTDLNFSITFDKKNTRYSSSKVGLTEEENKQLILYYRFFIENKTKNQFLDYINEKEIKDIRDKLYGNNESISYDNFIHFFTDENNKEHASILLTIIFKIIDQTQYIIRNLFTYKGVNNIGTSTVFLNYEKGFQEEDEKYYLLLFHIKQTNRFEEVDNVFSLWNVNEVTEWKTIKDELIQKVKKKKKPIYNILLIYHLIIEKQLAEDFDNTINYLQYLDFAPKFTQDFIYCFAMLTSDQKTTFIETTKSITGNSFIKQMIIQNDKSFIPNYTVLKQKKDIDLFSPIKFTTNINNETLILELLPYTTLYEVILIISYEKKIIFDAISIGDYDYNIPIVDIESRSITVDIDEQIEKNKEVIDALLPIYYEKYQPTVETFLNFISDCKKENLTKSIDFNSSDTFVKSLKNNYFVANLIIGIRKEGNTYTPYIKTTIDRNLIEKQEEYLIFMSEFDNKESITLSHLISLFYYLQRHHYQRDVPYSNVLSFWNQTINLDKKAIITKIKEILKNSDNKSEYYITSQKILPLSLNELFIGILLNEEDNDESFVRYIINELKTKRGIYFSNIGSNKAFSSFKLIQDELFNLLPFTSFFERLLIKLLNQDVNKKKNFDIMNNKLDVYDSNNVKYLFIKDGFHSLQDDVIALLNTYFSLVQNDTKQLEEVNFLPFIQKKYLESIQKALFSKGNAITREYFFEVLSKTEEEASLKILNLLIGFQTDNFYLRPYFQIEQLRKIMKIETNTIVLHKDPHYQKYFYIYYYLQCEFDKSITQNDNVLTVWEAKDIPKWNIIQNEFLPLLEKNNKEEFYIAIFLYYAIYRNEVPDDKLHYISYYMKIYSSTQNQFLKDSFSKLKHFIVKKLNNTKLIDNIRKEEYFNTILKDDDNNCPYSSFWSVIKNCNMMFTPLKIDVHNNDGLAKTYYLLPFTTIFELILKLTIDFKISFESIQLYYVNDKQSYKQSYQVTQYSYTLIVQGAKYLKSPNSISYYQIIKKENAIDYKKEDISRLLNRCQEKTINELLNFLNDDLKQQILKTYFNEVDNSDKQKISEILSNNGFLASILFKYEDNELTYRRNLIRNSLIQNESCINNIIFMHEKNIQPQYDNIFLSMYYFIQKELFYQDCSFDNILSFWYQKNINWENMSNWAEKYDDLQEQVAKSKEFDLYNILLFYLDIIKNKKKNKEIIEKFMNNQEIQSTIIYNYYLSYLINHEMTTKFTSEQTSKIIESCKNKGLMHYYSFVSKPFQNIECVTKITIYLENNSKMSYFFYSQSSIYEIMISLMFTHQTSIDYMTIKNKGKTITKNDYNKTIQDFTNHTFSLFISNVPKYLYYDEKGRLKNSVKAVLNLYFVINKNKDGSLKKNDFLTSFKKNLSIDSMKQYLFKNKSSLTNHEFLQRFEQKNNDSLSILYLIVEATGDEMFNLRNILLSKNIHLLKQNLQNETLFLSIDRTINLNYLKYSSILFQIRKKQYSNEAIKNVLSFWNDYDIPKWNDIENEILPLIKEEKKSNKNDNIYQEVLLYYLLILKEPFDLKKEYLKYLPKTNITQYIDVFIDIYSRLRVYEQNEMISHLAHLDSQLIEKINKKNQALLFFTHTVYTKEDLKLFNKKTLTINSSKDITTTSLTLLPFTTLYEVILILSMKEKKPFDAFSIKSYMELSKTINEIPNNTLDITLNTNLIDKLNQIYSQNKTEEIRELLSIYYDNYLSTKDTFLSYIHDETIDVIKKARIKQNDKDSFIQMLMKKEYYYLLNLFIGFRQKGDRIEYYIKCYINRNKDNEAQYHSIIFRKELDTNKSNDVLLSFYYYILRDVEQSQIPKDNILSFWYNKVDSFPSFAIKYNRDFLNVMLNFYYIIKNDYPNEKCSKILSFIPNIRPKNDFFDLKKINEEDIKDIVNTNHLYKQQYILLLFLTNMKRTDLSKENIEALFKNSKIEEFIREMLLKNKNNIETTIIQDFLNEISDKYKSPKPLLLYSNLSVDRIFQEFTDVMVYIKPYLLKKQNVTNKEFINFYKILDLKFDEIMTKAEYTNLFYFCGLYPYDSDFKLLTPINKFVQCLFNDNYDIKIRKGLFFFLSKLSFKPEQYILFNYFKKPKSIDEMWLYTFIIHLYNLSNYRMEIVNLDKDLNMEQKEMKEIFKMIEEKKEINIETIECQTIKRLLSNKNKKYKQIFELLVKNIKNKDKIHIIETSNSYIELRDKDKYTLKGIIILDKNKTLPKSILKIHNTWIQYTNQFEKCSYKLENQHILFDRLTDNKICFYEEENVFDNNEKDNYLQDYFNNVTEIDYFNNVTEIYSTLIYSNYIFYELCKESITEIKLDEVEKVDNIILKYNLLIKFKELKGNILTMEERIRYHNLIKDIKAKI